MKSLPVLHLPGPRDRTPPLSSAKMSFVSLCKYRKIWIQGKKKSVSRSVVSDSLKPHGEVHGILQARILERVADTRERSPTCIAGRFFTS